MNPKGKKLEPKLGLNMPFSELVQRLLQADQKEVEQSIDKAKQKNPSPTKVKHRKR
jgi:hypothetical protein